MGNNIICISNKNKERLSLQNRKLEILTDLNNRLQIQLKNFSNLPAHLQNSRDISYDISSLKFEIEGRFEKIENELKNKILNNKKLEEFQSFFPIFSPIVPLFEKCDNKTDEIDEYPIFCEHDLKKNEVFLFFCGKTD